MMNYSAPSPKDVITNSSPKQVNSPLPPQNQQPNQRRHDRGVLTPPSSDSNETTPPLTPEIGEEARELPGALTQLVAGHPATVFPPGYGYELDVRGDGGYSRGNADSLYKAFVARWCFAEGPPPGVAAGPDGLDMSRLTLVG
jgi:hypothetical protein